MRSGSQPDSSNGIYQFSVDTKLILQPRNRHCDQEAKDTIRSRIAEWIASDDPHIPRVSPSDVYLYQKGMCAISAVARSLHPGNEQSGGVVVFGWVSGIFMLLHLTPTTDGHTQRHPNVSRTAATETSSSTARAPLMSWTCWQTP